MQLWQACAKGATLGPTDVSDVGSEPCDKGEGGAAVGARVAQASEARGGMGVTVSTARGPAVRVADWMWECRSWRVVQPREACPAGLEYDMDMATRCQSGLAAGPPQSPAGGGGSFGHGGCR